VNERPKPLALYLFTGSRRTARDVIRRTSSGGACINDVMMQIANPFLPFGGVGSSGFGSYHGRASFDTFTHEKSVFANVTWIDLPLRYPPYTDLAFAMVKRVLR
jgi:aldehyde dehydrogenase (NAD+)